MNSKGRAAIFEYISSSPHLETSLEVAFHLAKQGIEVTYFHIGSALDFVDFSRSAAFMPRRLRHLVLHRLLGKPKRENKAIELSRLKATELGLPIDFVQITSLPSKNQPIPIKYLRSLEKLHEYRWAGVSIGTGIVNSLVGIFQNPDVRPIFHPGLIRKISRSYVAAFNWAQCVLSEIEFDRVVVYNGRFSIGSAISAAAKKADISVWFHERGGEDGKGYFFAPFSPLDSGAWADYMKDTWAFAASGALEQSTQIAISPFLREKRGRDLEGRPFNKESGDENRLPSDVVKFLHSPRKKVGFFSSSDFEYSALQELTPFSIFRNQREAVIALADAAMMADVELLIRVHPNAKNSRSESKWWDKRLKKIVDKDILIIPSSSSVNSYEVLSGLDLAVVWHSTMGIEAIFSGIPSAALNKCLYVLAGAEVPVPETIDEFKDLISARRNQLGTIESVLPYGYALTVSQHPFCYFEPLGTYSGRFFGEII